jgi:DNA-binding GntR family transcriptional regulator
MLDHSSPFAPALLPAAEPMSALAFKRLRQAIIGVELIPGSIVGETELAERYKLGRASVRAALARLACAGLVEARARHGWLVAPVTGLLIGEILAARRSIEPSLAEVRLSPREGERLTALVAMNQILRGQGGPALVTARSNDRQILELLAQHLDSLRMRWLGEVWDHSDRIDAWLGRANSLRWPSDREALLAALLGGQAADARREIKADIGNFEMHAARSFLHSPMHLSVRQHDGAPRVAQVRVSPSTNPATAGKKMIP